MARRRGQVEVRPPFSHGDAARAAIGMVMAFRDSVSIGEVEVGRVMRDIAQIEDSEQMMQSLGNVVGYLVLFAQTFAEDNARAGGRGYEWLQEFALAAEGQ